jgi:glutathionyl-hydroquinone reductase
MAATAMMPHRSIAASASLTLSAQQLYDAALNMLHIKRHYYGSHPSLNSLGIIPAGPPGESSHFSGPPPQYRLLLA